MDHNEVKSMQHWNNDQMCAIDIETTGLDCAYHEIWQICILPLNNKIEPRRDIIPLYIKIAPDYEERIDWTDVLNKSKIKSALRNGMDKRKAADLLIDYIRTRLDLGTTKYGTSKRIIPLGHNYSFDKGFIEQWLDPLVYNELFDVRIRDTMLIANFLNDLANFKAEKVPFEKVQLSWISNNLNIKTIGPHDALVDCLTTAKVYKEMCTKMNKLIL